MTGPELTLILQQAGLEPPEVSYTKEWLDEIGTRYISRPPPWPINDKVILLSVLAQLGMPGMSMTYEEALELFESEETR